jgi:hypothetical protein
MMLAPPPAPFLEGAGLPGDKCMCPCFHKPACYLCRRDRHMLDRPRPFTSPALPRQVA